MEGAVALGQVQEDQAGREVDLGEDSPVVEGRIDEILQ